MKLKNRRAIKLIIYAIVVAFLCMNIFAFMHAYRFTHFSTSNVQRTGDPKDLSTAEKLNTIFLGIQNPKPVNHVEPAFPYETTYIKGDVTLEGWLIKNDTAKGTVIVFHGYCGKKSDMLERSYEFYHMGYSVLIMDFMGSGGSDGYTTSIGYHESEQVKSCYEHVVASGEKNIFLFGTSMGAAAILKSIHDFNLSPKSIILECPFGSLYTTTCARFNNMGVPSFPMAGILLFWGGVQNNFWPFGHNPSEYAKQVRSPALLIYGEQDDRVSLQETQDIYNNLKGKKHLAAYADAAHNDLYTINKERWRSDITYFISFTNEP